MQFTINGINKNFLSLMDAEIYAIKMLADEPDGSKVRVQNARVTSTIIRDRGAKHWTHNGYKFMGVTVN